MVWRKLFWNINYSKAALKDETNTALLRQLGRVVDNDGAEKENASWPKCCRVFDGNSKMWEWI